MLDQNSIRIEDFRGLYRWYDEDTVPPNSFKDCLNLEYIPKGFGARSGLVLTHDTEGGGIQILRIKRYEIPGAADRLIALDNNGNFWDTANPGGIGGSSILTIVGCTDFALVSLFGRAYISPHNSEEGLQDTALYVYDPAESLLARIAAGDPPSDFSLTVATLTPTAAGTDVVAPVAPANGALTLTTSPFIPNTPRTLIFTQTGGAVTAETFTIVGLDAAGEAQTEIYVDKIKSAGPTTFTAFETWSQVTSATVSALAGAGGTWKIEITGQPPGKIERGYHIIAIAYETTSGFVTAPGPATAVGTNYAVFLVKKGKKALTVSGIPTTGLPSFVNKIHILASKAIPKDRYTGNPDEYELFFVPDLSGGEIDPGVASSNINFFDADLVDSADFLKDNMSQIPAGVTLLSTSTGRLLVAGVNSTSVVGDESPDNDLANNTVIFGSKGGEPESFSKTDGFVIVKPGGGGIRNLAEYRSLIYTYKGTRTYVTQDNGGLPVEWEINSVDDAIGTECHGVSIALGSDSASEDVLLLASRSGFQVFNGTYAERPLSWPIRELWDAIVREDRFNEIEVALDPINKHIFIAVPFTIGDLYDDGIILFGDYSDGLNWEAVKWCPWQLYRTDGTVQILTPTTIFTTFDNDTPVLRIGSADFNIYTYEYRSGINNDNGTAREAFFETAKLSFSEDGGVSQINGIRLMINGACTLENTLIGPDDVVVSSLPNTSIANPNPFNVLMKTNFVEDDFSYQGRITVLDDTFQITKLWLFGQEAWSERPA